MCVHLIWKIWTCTHTHEQNKTKIFTHTWKTPSTHQHVRPFDLQNLNMRTHTNKTKKCIQTYIQNTFHTSPCASISIRHLLGRGLSFPTTAYVRERVCACACVFVCVRVRVSVCMYVYICACHLSELPHNCVRERERESVCVCVCVRVSVSVCMYVS